MIVWGHRTVKGSFGSYLTVMAYMTVIISDNRHLDVPYTEWLSSLRAHVVPSGIGRARAELFEKQIIQHGGQICTAQAPGVTHIVVDEGMDCERALRLLRLPRLPQGAQLVKSTWLSLCLQERRLVDTAGFSIYIPNRWVGSSLSSVFSGSILSSPLGLFKITFIVLIGHIRKPRSESRVLGAEVGPDLWDLNLPSPSLQVPGPTTRQQGRPRLFCSSWSP